MIDSRWLEGRIQDAMGYCCELASKIEKIEKRLDRIQEVQEKRPKRPPQAQITLAKAIEEIDKGNWTGMEFPVGSKGKKAVCKKNSKGIVIEVR